MLTILAAVAFVVVFIYYHATRQSRDVSKIRAALTNDPGTIVELKLVSTPDPYFRRGGGGPRIYRVVLEIPNGGRILHRFEVRHFGPPERLL